MFHPCVTSILKSLMLFELLKSDNSINESTSSEEKVDYPIIDFAGNNHVDATGRCYTVNFAQFRVNERIAARIPSGVWSEYVRAYPRGPFVNWQIGNYEMGKPLFTEDIQFIDQRFFDDNCLIVDYKTDKKRIVGCDDKYLRIRTDNCVSYRTCEKFYYYFGEKECSHLNVLSEENNMNDDIFIQEVEINPGHYRLGELKYEGKLLSSVRNVSLISSNLDFENFTQLRYRKLQEMNATYILKEKEIPYRLITQEDMSKKKNILLSINEDVMYNKFDNSSIYCFTDAVTYFPIRVNVINITLSIGKLETVGDGYYWCVLKEYNAIRKMLYIRNLKETAKTWAIMIKTKDSAVFGMNITADDEKRILSNSDFVQRIPKINLVQLRRTHYDGTILLHVTFYKGVNPFEGIEFNDVVYQRNVYGCNSSHLTNDNTGKRYLMPIGKVFCAITDGEPGCTEYECVGDFNTGVFWQKTNKKTHSAMNNELSLDFLKQAEITRASIERALDFIDSIQTRGSITSSIPQDLESAMDRMYLPPETEGKLVMERNEVSLAIIENEKFSVSKMRVKRAMNNSSPSSMFFNEVEDSPDNTDVLIDISTITKTTTRTTFSIYNSDVLFGQSSSSIVNSKIVGVTMRGSETFNEGDFIDILFRPKLNVLRSDQVKACSFWNNGSWSTEGCELIPADGDGGLDKCRCTHLSLFSQLIMTHRDSIGKVNEAILTAITYFGCTLSLLGVIGICLTGALFKSWRSEFSNKIWMNLSISIGILIIIFLMNAILYTTHKSRSFCILLGVFLHYSVLSTFCWMFLSAVLAYKKLVQVFNSGTSNKLLKVCLFGWLFPLIPIILLVSISHKSYTAHLKEFGSYKEFCYPSGLGFYLSVLLPVIIVILVNSVLLIVIIKSVFFKSKIRYHGDKHELKQRITVSFLLFFLFGISWIFGLASGNIVANYLFCITCSMQGFVLFMFFIVANKKTRKLWYNPKKRTTSYDISQSTTDSFIKKRIRSEILSLPTTTLV